MRALGKWSINNSVTVNLIMVFIIVAGVFTVVKMRRELFPQFALDMIYMSVAYPGSSVCPGYDLHERGLPRIEP
jgi:multidrug efflux pump subunit AcrB